MLATILHQEIEEKNPALCISCASRSFLPSQYQKPTQTIRFLKIHNSLIDGHDFESKNNSTAL
jgi:hypothetical protein